MNLLFLPEVCLIMEAGVWVWADHNSYTWDRMVYQSSSSSDEEEASLTLVGTLFL